MNIRPFDKPGGFYRGNLHTHSTAFRRRAQPACGVLLLSAPRLRLHQPDRPLPGGVRLPGVRYDALPHGRVYHRARRRAACPEDQPRRELAHPGGRAAARLRAHRVARDRRWARRPGAGRGRVRCRGASGLVRPDRSRRTVADRGQRHRDIQHDLPGAQRQGRQRRLPRPAAEPGALLSRHRNRRRPLSRRAAGRRAELGDGAQQSPGAPRRCSTRCTPAASTPARARRFSTSR